MTEPTNIEGKIRDWLDVQGYPLEMRVARTLQSHEFRVIQSEFYEDPENGDSREIDVYAFQQRKVADVLMRVSLAIECKRSVDKPWLSFTSPAARLADRARVIQRMASPIGHALLREIVDYAEVQDAPLFFLPERCAYGLTQAFTSGKDICYSAITSVTKAALSKARQGNAKGKPTHPILRQKVCEVVFPVIIVEGRLFEVYLSDESNVIVSGIDSAVLLWRNPLSGQPHTIVNLVASEALDTFAQSARESVRRLFDLPEERLQQAMLAAVERSKRQSVTVL